MQLLKDKGCGVQMLLGDSPRARSCEEPADGQAAERREVAFAQQIEQGRALRVVVIRLRGPIAQLVQQAAQAQELGPCCRCAARIELVGREGQTRFGFFEPRRCSQGLASHQRHLQRIERWRPRLYRLVGEGHRLVQCASTQRQPRKEHAHGPVVPPVGLPAVGAVGIACPLEVIARSLVVALDQMNLGERVLHCARGFVELYRVGYAQCAVQHLFGATEVAETNQDLAHARERHRQTVSGPVSLMQGHASLCERQCLLVSVLEGQYRRLVANNRPDHIVSVDARREPLGRAQARHRFDIASDLSEGNAGERVDEAEVSSVARRVKGRRGLCEMLANNRRVTDLSIAERKLVVGESDGARIVRRVCVLQRATLKSDGSRLVTARGSDAPVQSPQRRESRRRHGVAEGVRRAAEHRGRLVDIVLQQPRFGESGAHSQFFVARKYGRTQQWRERLDSLWASTAFECGARAREQCVQGG